MLFCLITVGVIFLSLSLFQVSLEVCLKIIWEGKEIDNFFIHNFVLKAYVLTDITVLIKKSAYNRFI